MASTAERSTPQASAASLTHDGEAYAAGLSQVFDQLHELTAVRMAGARSDTLRIGAYPTFADKVLIPLQPSIFDIHATHDFINQLLDHRRGPNVQLAVVGTRTREGTISTDQLRSFLESVRVPLLGFLRDTQNYVHLAAHGLTLWDVSSVRFERDREQWEPIMVWVN